MSKLSVFRSIVTVALLSVTLPRGYAAESEGMLDYGHAFYFADSAEGNRVRVAIQSRILLGPDSDQSEYLLLQTHPREQTFQDDGNIYQDMVLHARGASSINVMLKRDGTDGLISRRYETTGLEPEALRQCVDSIYSATSAPATVTDFRQLRGLSDIEASLAAGDQIIGRATYVAGGIPATIEFPVPVFNINADASATDGKQWQAASSQIPIFLSASFGCSNLYVGYMAFNRLEGPLQFIYLCPTEKDNTKQDYSCTINIDGQVSLYAPLHEAQQTLKSATNVSD